MVRAREAAGGSWWQSWLGLKRLERRELRWLTVGLGVSILLFVFVTLAGEVTEGDTQAFDTRILLALRKADDPTKPIGPDGIESVLLDLTAIGGPTVLALVVLAVLGFLVLQARYRTALFIFATALGGEVLNSSLKYMFNRPRPSIVPHLRAVFSTSFPSGHAMESAIVYLTLGAILMRVAKGRLTKVYCLALAIMATMLVGVSRVYLGVHYPTDVIGGWIIGFAWALVCWLVAQHFEERAGIDAERNKSE